MQLWTFVVVFALLGFLSNTALGDAPAMTGVTKYWCNPTNMANNNPNSGSDIVSFGSFSITMGVGYSSDAMCATKDAASYEELTTIKVPVDQMSASTGAGYLFQLKPNYGMKWQFGDGGTCTTPGGTYMCTHGS